MTIKFMEKFCNIKINKIKQLIDIQTQGRSEAFVDGRCKM